MPSSTTRVFPCDAIELVYDNPSANSHKFYALYLITDSVGWKVITQWGRVGANGQFRIEYFSSSGSAQDFFDRTAWQKQQKGYEVVRRRTFDINEDVAKDPLKFGPGLYKMFRTGNAGTGGEDLNPPKGSRQAKQEEREIEDFKKTLLQMSKRLGAHDG